MGRPAVQRRSSGSLPAAALLVAAITAWALLAGPEAGVGRMGRSAVGYLAMWSVMMGAMMVSPLAWFAYGYAAAIGRAGGRASVRTARTASLACGYALVWLAAGIGALGFASAADAFAGIQPSAVPRAGGVVFAGAALYQLSRLKERCLSKYRSPLGFALAASGFRGPLRDARAGALHGAWCLGCCWHLMLVVVAVGTMDLRWIGLAALILVERAWARSQPLVRASGIAFFVAAGLVPWLDAVAPGLHAAGMDMK